MENRTKWMGVVIGIIVAVLAVVIIGWLIAANNDHDMIIDETETTYEMLENTTSGNNNVKSFYLKYNGEKVVIYTEPDRKFYDNADINMEVLPPEIREQLKLGMYMDGEDNLYDFLQTYSS